VILPGGQPPRRTRLDPDHSHFLLVPGDEWGAEARWIARVATVLAGDTPSATVLINGGEIAYSDVERSVAAGRSVLAVAGSGRTADHLAAELQRDGARPRRVHLRRTVVVPPEPGRAHTPCRLTEPGLGKWTPAANTGSPIRRGPAPDGPGRWLDQELGELGVEVGWRGRSAQQKGRSR
jgi:hypothetical protein